VNSKGWKRFAKKYREAAEQTGRAAVYPMLKDEILEDRLIRANQSLKMITEVEQIAARLEELEEKAREIKKQSSL